MARKPKAPLPSWIVEQRKLRGLKPGDLAARLGVAETTIRGWETGRGVSAENVAALERLFGVAAPDAPQPADMGALVGALTAQTAAITDLVMRLEGREVGVAEMKASYGDVDEATRRRRRAYWIDQAVSETKLTRPQLRAAVGLPAGRESTLRRWLDGELPKGAELERFARALMLPLNVLEEPPATDLERLVGWRRETLGELPPVEQPEPARKRRTA